MSNENRKLEMGSVTNCIYRNIWCQINYDGYTLSYKAYSLWCGLFKLLRLTTSCDTPINVVLSYKLKRGLLSRRLSLDTYRYALNGKLRIVRLRTIWGINKSLSLRLEKDIAQIIKLNKSGENIGVSLVSPELIKNYYNTDNPSSQREGSKAAQSLNIDLREITKYDLTGRIKEGKDPSAEMI